MILSPNTMTPEDLSVVSPSVWPMPGTIAWATDGTSHVYASGDAAIALGYGPSVTDATTSTCINGVMTGYAALAMVGATSAVGSPVCPATDSGIMDITSCSATSEGAP